MAHAFATTLVKFYPKDQIFRPYDAGEIHSDIHKNNGIKNTRSKHFDVDDLKWALATSTMKKVVNKFFPRLDLTDPSWSTGSVITGYFKKGYRIIYPAIGKEKFRCLLDDVWKKNSAGILLYY